MSLFHDIADAIKAGIQSRSEVESTVDKLKNRLPVYWPENFDEHRGHIVTSDRKDWDVCDECGEYDEVYYWYSPAAINEHGEIVREKQLPLCRRCQPV